MARYTMSHGSLYSRLRELSKNPITYVIAAFGVSRAIFHFAGIRFDASSIVKFHQFIDPPLLQERLFESLFYHHYQPPLFNLFLGVVLKAFPKGYPTAFAVIYLLMGFAIAVCLYRLLFGLGLKGHVAAIITILFVVGPATILYENWLFYTYPETLLLCGSSLLLFRFASTERLRDGVIFFALLATLVLTRSMFHMVWFILIVALVVASKRALWKRVLLAASVPFLLVFLVYAKNFFVFGSFTSSVSGFGMGISKLTTFQLSEEARADLVRQGKLSPYAMILPFSNPSDYERLLPDIPETGIPVLDQRMKSNGYSPNLNNIIYIHVTKGYVKDAMTILTEYPLAYLSGLGKSWMIYFFPATDFTFVRSNLAHITRYDRLYNAVFCGKWFSPASVGARRMFERVVRRFLSLVGADVELIQDVSHYTARLTGVGLFLVIGLPLLVAYGAYLIVKEMRRRPRNVPLLITLVFVCISVLYVTVIANGVEIDENNRYRYVIDPLYIAIAGVFLSRIRGGRFGSAKAETSVG